MPEILWAPWRMKYVERASVDADGSGNIFVDLPAREDDRTNLILHRGELAFVLLNAFPYANGHLLVAPFRQISDITLLSDPELLELNQLVARAVRWIRVAYRPDSFNIGVNMGAAAGAGIPQHIHWHVVPRWNGDTNFMTSIMDTRVMPQSLDESYGRLLEAKGT